MKVEAHLTLDKIRHDQDTDAHLVLTVTAPPIEAQTKRPSLCIIPVIDVSPSMFEHRGEKIAYAKRSVEKLIEHLGPGDYCGLVQFSSSAEVLQKPVKITADSKATLKRKVTELSCGNATNIADALLVGLDLGNKADLPGSVIVRVILFTDGQANRGPATKQGDLVRLLEANLGSCTASAFGYGSDADQNLLGELAKKGSGNYAFVQNPDDALTAFGKELGGLLSTFATNMLINVSACANHEITAVISDVDSEEEKIGQGVRIKIPDILAEEVRRIVLGVKLKAQKAGGPRAVNVFEVKAGWDILDVNSKKERKGIEVKAKVQFVSKDDAQKTPNAELDKVVSLAEVIHAQLEAEDFAKKGDYKGAQKRMKLAANHATSRGHGQAAYLADQVGARVGSAHDYGSNGGYLRSVSGGVNRGYGVASYDAGAHADLMHAGVAQASLSNSSQTSTSNAFAGGAPLVGTPAPAHFDLFAPQPHTAVAPGGIVGLSVGGIGAPFVTGTVIGTGPIVGDMTGGLAWGAGHAPGLGDALAWTPPPAPVPQHVAAPLPRTNSEDAKASKKSKLSKKAKTW